MKIFNLLILLLPTFLVGQKSLSLREAIRLALENHYQIKIARINEGIAQNNNSWSNAGAYPQVQLAANPNLLSNSVNQKFINGTEINRSNAISRNINANIQLNYNILNGFNVFTTKAKLETLQELSSAELELMILDMIKKVSEDYYRIQSLNNNLMALEAQNKVALNRVEIEKKRYDLGNKGKTNYLQALLDQQDLTVLIKKQRNAIEEEVNLLKHYIHYVSNENIVLSDSLNHQVLMVQPELELKSVPQKILQIKSKIKNLEYTELKRQRLPNLSLVADYRYNRSNNQAGFNLFSQSYGPSAGIQLTMPLYDAGTTTRLINENKLESEKLSVEYEDLQREIQFQLNLNKNRFEFYNSIYQLEELKLPIAEENLMILQKKAELGESNSFEVSQSLFRLVEISASRNDALYNAMLMKINDKYLRGILD
ncbi:MAG: TolC family protein [Saprospiraceae bacterium]|nr:TolC family protein [Saprospiraceae bacterium]